MRHYILATCAIALLAASPALAASSDDAAYDKGARPIGDSNGKCVRTKWQQDSDPCSIEQPAPAPVVAAPEPAPAPMPVVTLEQRTIYFDFDSAELTPDATAKLDQLGAIVNSSQAIADVRIHGFTDQFGSSSYNETLANKRAAAVKSYLDGRSRISTTVAEVKGLGKSAPAAGCESFKARDEKIVCMAQERRVEIEFKAQVQ